MKPLWESDDELFSMARQELFTAVVGDIMDKLGLYHQFLPPQIRPLSPAMVPRRVRFSFCRRDPPGSQLLP